jgi:hypothetical protein
MPKFPHDDFSKAYLTELLSTIGKATPNHPLKAETQEADLWFELNPKAQANRPLLGLLGQLLTRNSLIEVFRNPATPIEIRTCQGKLIDKETELLRKAKRRKQTLAETDLPELWLIMPTCSQEIRSGFGTSPTKTKGVYRFPHYQRTGLIVVHQLPKTESTRWLRILGRATNQQQAIDEFAQLPSKNSLYASIDELLGNYLAILESRRQLTSEDEELIMNLSAAYLRKQQEWKQECRQETLTEVAINMLQQDFAADVIAKATGLSVRKINQLRKTIEPSP